MTAPNAQETRHQCMHRQAVPLNVGGGVRLVRGLRVCQTKKRSFVLVQNQSPFETKWDIRVWSCPTTVGNPS